MTVGLVLLLYANCALYDLCTTGIDVGFTITASTVMEGNVDIHELPLCVERGTLERSVVIGYKSVPSKG